MIDVRILLRLYMILHQQSTVFSTSISSQYLSLPALRSVDSITEVVINFHYSLCFPAQAAVGGSNSFKRAWHTSSWQSLRLLLEQLNLNSNTCLYTPCDQT